MLNIIQKKYESGSKYLSLNLGFSLRFISDATFSFDFLLKIFLVSLYNFDKNGELLETYDKIHLFRIDIKSNENSLVIDEGKTYQAGSELKSFKFGEFNFGLSVCFDLRFPELYRSHFHTGCNVFLVSSAFTKTTGKAHWETLLKARAIENQSFVIACNQWGEHNARLTSYGHSMVIDPWGEIIVNAGEGEKVAYFDIDLSRVEKIRSRMKMQKQLPT